MSLTHKIFAAFRSNVSSSPPISPGCEDQQMNDSLHARYSDYFDPKNQMANSGQLQGHQGFSPYYRSYPHTFLGPNAPGFHRTLDATGKPMQVCFCKFARYSIVNIMLFQLIIVSHGSRNGAQSSINGFFGKRWNFMF